mmetsp:Transcript_24714/g.36233  ORF Transcript_24714/g.36233 Transcript_24714/m.36233 type:complete len:308 (-) Transcript_24714:297-1220(-)|eukprot:CAMPEP_0195517858 /NCGR_PEP_ID=MMETSP0794_2-20130614/11790_1 /TAXON_ID=515487 /ORGANISM="Stephanopyxis turris, Strain CCMP 815" /LENGTH=307 /DNA_ID=CAMNT_0040646733 /DNA_START=81 /DNA_END=1004 /DNA_ORIENTATION=-
MEVSTSNRKDRLIDGTASDENSFQNAKGLSIYYKKWLPKDPTTIKGLLICMHGIGEHCDRYSHLFEKIAANDIAVFSMDHHGHGKSEGERVSCNSLTDFVDDGNQLTKLAKEQLSASSSSSINLLTFLMGISFGGLVSCHMDLSKAHSWDGLIICAGALGVELNCVMKIQKALSSLLYLLVPRVRMVPAVRLEDLSKDLNAVKQYAEDPLNVVGNLRVNVGYHTLKGMEKLEKERSNIAAPVLVIHGSADKCTDPKAAEEFCAATGSSDRTFKLFDGLYHMIFHEPEQEEVINYVVNWIQQRALVAP